MVTLELVLDADHVDDQGAQWAPVEAARDTQCFICGDDIHAGDDSWESEDGDAACDACVCVDDPDSRHY